MYLQSKVGKRLRHRWAVVVAGSLTREDLLQDLECAQAANERFPLIVVDLIEVTDTSTFRVRKTSNFENTESLSSMDVQYPDDLTRLPPLSPTRAPARKLYTNFRGRLISQSKPEKDAA